MQNYSFLIESNIYMQEGFWSDAWDTTKHAAHRALNTVVKGHREGRAERQRIRNEHPVLSRISDGLDNILDTRAAIKAGQSSIDKGDSYATASRKAATAGAKRRFKREASRHVLDTVVGSVKRGVKAAQLKKARKDAGGSTFRKAE